jgi:hypothetical protein
MRVKGRWYRTTRNVEPIVHQEDERVALRETPCTQHFDGGLPLPDEGLGSGVLSTRSTRRLTSAESVVALTVMVTPAFVQRPKRGLGLKSLVGRVGSRLSLWAGTC